MLIELSPTPTVSTTGNHAGCLALAAQAHGIPAHIVMPSNAPGPKLAATKGYGALVSLCEPTSEAREARLNEVQAATGSTFVPPYDHANTILGQGTIFLEMEEQSLEGGWGKLAAVVAPVGGGGLIAGIAIAAKGTGTRVFGAGELLFRLPIPWNTHISLRDSKSLRARMIARGVSRPGNASPRSCR